MPRKKATRTVDTSGRWNVAELMRLQRAFVDENGDPSSLARDVMRMMIRFLIASYGLPTQDRKLFAGRLRGRLGRFIQRHNSQMRTQFPKVFTQRLTAVLLKELFRASEFERDRWLRQMHFDMLRRRYESGRLQYSYKKVRREERELCRQAVNTLSVDSADKDRIWGNRGRAHEAFFDECDEMQGLIGQHNQRAWKQAVLIGLPIAIFPLFMALYFYSFNYSSAFVVGSVFAYFVLLPLLVYIVKEAVFRLQKSNFTLEAISTRDQNKLLDWLRPGVEALVRMEEFDQPVVKGKRGAERPKEDYPSEPRLYPEPHPTGKKRPRRQDDGGAGSSTKRILRELSPRREELVYHLTWKVEGCDVEYDSHAYTDVIELWTLEPARKPMNRRFFVWWNADQIQRAFRNHQDFLPVFKRVAWDGHMVRSENAQGFDRTPTDGENSFKVKVLDTQAGGWRLHFFPVATVCAPIGEQTADRILLGRPDLRQHS